MAFNSMYKGHSVLPARTSEPTSKKGQEAARRRKERELNRQQKAAQKEADLRAILVHERAQHAEQTAQAGVAKTVAGEARRLQLSDENAARLEHGVENLRRSFRPTPEKPRFDPYAAIDEVMAKVQPQGHIARNQGALTREQRITENETYAAKLKRLGLQDPRNPSVVGSGISGLGQ